MIGKKKFDDLKNGITMIEQGIRMLNSGPISYYAEEMMGAYEYLMKRFSPFQAEDRIELTHTIHVTKDSGWWGFRDNLVEGAKGTVKSAECGSEGFSYLVEFDEMGNGALFSFGENHLRLRKESQGTQGEGGLPSNDHPTNAQSTT